MARISRSPRSARAGRAIAARLRTVLVAVITTLCAVMAAAAPAAAAVHPRSPAPVVHRPKVPSLSISVTDGRRAVRAGDRLTYLMRLANSGMISVPQLTITLTRPPFLRFISASHQGVPAAGKVTWHAGLPVGHTVTLRASMLVTRVPVGIARLAAVACAVARGSRPVVCAAHLDRLLGTVSGAGRPAGTVSAGQAGGMTAGTLIGYALAVIAALATGALLMLARRRARPLRRARRSAPLPEHRSGH